jgi:hypothetical protein
MAIRKNDMIMGSIDTWESRKRRADEEWDPVRRDGMETDSIETETGALQSDEVGGGTSSDDEGGFQTCEEKSDSENEWESNGRF